MRSFCVLLVRRDIWDFWFDACFFLTTSRWNLSMSYWPSKSTRNFLCLNLTSFHHYPYPKLCSASNSVRSIKWKIIFLFVGLSLSLAACLWESATAKAVCSVFFLNAFHLILLCICDSLLRCSFILTLACLHMLIPTSILSCFETFPYLWKLQLKQHDHHSRLEKSALLHLLITLQ